MTTAQDFLVLEERMRPLHEAVLDDLLIQDGVPLLAIGGNTGAFLRLAAGRGAAVTGIDDLTAREPTSLPHTDGTFAIVTLFDVHRFTDDRCVVVRESGRVARRGAPVVLTTWARPERCEAAAYLRAMTDLRPPTRGAPDPFALSGEGALEAFAAAGGLTPIERRDAPCDWVFPDEATALQALASAGIAVEATRSLGVDAVADTIRHAIQPYATSDGGFCLENTFTYLVART